MRDININMDAKTIVIILSILVTLIGGGLTWQLDLLDVHTSNCSYFKLREGMNSQQREVFDLFVKADYCEIGNCETGMVRDEFLPILERLGKENPEFHKRIVYYITECKDKNGG